MGSCRTAFASALVAVGVVACAGCAALRPATPASLRDGVLVDKQSRRTLYTFDRDVPASGTIGCVGECLRNWPPFTAEAAARPVRDYSLLFRGASEPQWTYKGKPLYFFASDKQPGDRNGDGVANLWRAARP